MGMEEGKMEKLLGRLGPGPFLRPGVARGAAGECFDRAIRFAIASRIRSLRITFCWRKGSRHLAQH